jgi:hypothetical protein
MNPIVLALFTAATLVSTAFGSVLVAMFTA